MERTLRQLQSLGSEVNNDTMLRLLMTKISTQVLDVLELAKENEKHWTVPSLAEGSDKNWTVPSFRKAYRHLVQVRARLERHANQPELQPCSSQGAEAMNSSHSDEIDDQFE